MKTKSPQVIGILVSIILITALAMGIASKGEQDRDSIDPSKITAVDLLEEEKVFAAHRTPEQKQIVKKATPIIMSIAEKKFDKRPAEVNFSFNKLTEKIKSVDIFFYNNKKWNKDFTESRLGISLGETESRDDDYYIDYPIAFSLLMDDASPNRDDFAGKVAAKMDYVITNIYLERIKRNDIEVDETITKQYPGLEVNDFDQALNQDQAKIFLQNYADLYKQSRVALAKNILRLGIINPAATQPRVTPIEVSANLHKLAKVSEFYVRPISQTAEISIYDEFPLDKIILFKVVPLKQNQEKLVNLEIQEAEFFGPKKSPKYKLTNVKKINEHLYRGILTGVENVRQVEILTKLINPLAKSTAEVQRK